MLVFGGMVIRDKKDPNGQNLYETCETFNLEEVDPKYKNCGMELSNDIWRYHIATDSWSQIKPDQTDSISPFP